MKTHIAYCSACDHDVRIALPEEPLFDGHANLVDPEVVCLEIGESCTGNMCPIGAQPASVMKARLVKAGMEFRLQPVVGSHCEGCTQESEFVLIDKEYATCVNCGHTVPRATIR